MNAQVATRRQAIAWVASPRKHVPREQKSQRDDMCNIGFESCRRVATEIAGMDGTLGLAS